MQQETNRQSATVTYKLLTNVHVCWTIGVICRFVMAHVSHMVYDEYLPVLLGTILPAYVGYNASMNPSMDNFFAAAAYRYGHATITDVVYRLDEKWQQHSQVTLQRVHPPVAAQGITRQRRFVCGSMHALQRTALIALQGM